MVRNGYKDTDRAALVNLAYVKVTSACLHTKLREASKAVANARGPRVSPESPNWLLGCSSLEASGTRTVPHSAASIRFPVERSRMATDINPEKIP